MNIDVVCFYRRTRSEELRYMLRSLTNIGNPHVWLVGDPAPFRTHPYHLTWVPSNHLGPTPQDIARHHLMHFFATVPITSYTLYLFNDDFFVLDPHPEPIPLYHRGPVADLDTRYDRAGLPVADDYIRSEQATGTLLEQQWAVPNPLSYSLHVPMPIQRRLCISILPAIPQGIRFRTFYGNLAADEHPAGGYMPDVKVRRTDEYPSGLNPFVSTYEKSFTHGVIGDHIRGLFPDPSPYEA
jgi:hypothetical protein